MPDPIPADLSAFAGEIDKLAQSGGFNPFALLAGQTAFHSVFIAPFSPSLESAIARFLADGTGPLADIGKAFQQQGAAPAEASQQARAMFAAAQGMLVVVQVGDHGPTTIPQLHFGGIDETFCAHALAACGEQFPAKDALRAALADLRAKAQGGTTWPALIAGPGAGSNLVAYWEELGDALVDGLDQGAGQGGLERLRDLAHWVARALPACGKALKEDAILVAVRCHLAADEAAQGQALLAGLLSEDADADHLAELVVHLADAAIRQGQGAASGLWLADFVPRFETLFGTCYELRLAAFKLAAAAGAAEPVMLAAAAGLMGANRKSARQDLTREPLWRVTAADPGELLDTAAAAALLERSPTFIAKRLEQGTIPTVRRLENGNEVVRLPRPALLAWKAIMDAHKLLD
jgi:hypothetical protein